MNDTSMHRLTRVAVTVAALLLQESFLVAQSPVPGGQACPGSTVDTQGAEFARKSRAFLADLQTAISKHNQAKIASLTSYPLLVIRNGQRTRIRTQAQFISKYNTIFDEHVRHAIAGQSAECLFGNDQGAMVGKGEVWFAEQPDGAMKIITVNPGAGAP